MAKPSSLGITWEDVQKELSSLPNNKEKPKIINLLDEEQKRILCGMMRSGKRMEDISRIWMECGCPAASQNTMRRMFRELREKGY